MLASGQLLIEPGATWPPVRPPALRTDPMRSPTLALLILASLPACGVEELQAILDKYHQAVLAQW